MIPVRCFSCGKVVASGYEDFKARTKAGEDSGQVLNDLGYTRYCCRRMLLSHIEMVDVIAPYQ